jgi:mannosylglycerate hydrolase
LKAFVVPHTHWDREWYEPFETFRSRLVAVIDRVVEILEDDPRFPSFTLDGQAIVLEDYLVVKPERREALEHLIRQGRLRIGPWYVLADEFLVSPEALVRNLSLGRALCQQFGDYLPVAYTPDSFGHISQLPLLAHGFGLSSIVFERGVGDEGERLRGEFVWRAADGETQVFTAHLLGTYSAFTAIGHADWELQDTYLKERAINHARAALYGTAGTDVSFLPTWFRASLERVPGGISAYAQAGALLLLNGSDHLYPQANLPDVLDDLRQAFPEIDFVHGDVEAFVTQAQATAREVAYHQGEFRASRYQHILSGVLSARLYLKQANFEAETRLERVTEPLTTLAWLKGAPYPQALLHHAWRTLLKNHPHDSICGCSIDAVHDEMMTRFGACGHSADYLERQALRHLQSEHGARAITAFNPHPYPLIRNVTCRLILPPGEGEGLELLSESGERLPLHCDVIPGQRPGSTDPVDEVTLNFDASLRPLGFTTFTLHHGSSQIPHTQTGAPDQTLVLENAYLQVEVSPEGDMTLLHKTSGERFPLGLHFEDVADAGDEYDFSPLAGDAPVRITQVTTPPEVIEHSAVRSALRLCYQADLPSHLSQSRRERMGKVPLAITMDLILERSSPSLRLAIALSNLARDHRLRLRLATGCRSETVWADGHFDVVERPVRPPSGEGWFQQPQPTNHQRGFVLAQDGLRGLAVLNRGLAEYEAIPMPGGVDLAVTLIRAIGWLSRDDLTSRPQGAGPSRATPGAQCLGQHRFELALYPFSGHWWRSEVAREAGLLAQPPLTYLGVHGAGGICYLEIEGALQLSAFKRAEERESLIVRVFNPAPETVQGRIILAEAPAESYETRLDETRLSVLEPSQTLALTLAPKTVRTFEFVPAKGVIARPN